MKAAGYGVLLTIVLAGGVPLTGSGQEVPRPDSFSQCAVCHSTDGTNGTGPTLRGLFGRTAGSVPGFRYSRAMRGAGVTWDARTLDDYLRSPQEFVPGNVMPFSGVPDAAERTGLIAYLRSLK